MALVALRGVDSLGKKAKKVKKKKPVEAPQAQVLPPEQIVREPRLTPARHEQHVAAMYSEMAITGDEAMAKGEHTQMRREEVRAWMMNGHTHNGVLVTESELAKCLNVPLKTVQIDIKELKDQHSKFFLGNDERDLPALAFALMEMRFQDRGRALALFNIIRNDIERSDAQTKELIQMRKDGKIASNVKIDALTGRDRASMYSAALAALDMANRATKGMDDLFKITGSGAKLQAIVKAHSLVINNNNLNVMPVKMLQEFVSKEFAGVLPSARRAGDLAVPKAIQMTDEDDEIMQIGINERKGQ